MKQIVLKRHPSGDPCADDFTIESAPMPTPAENEILVRTLWLSMDPLIRFALDEVTLTGRTHVDIGEVVYGGAILQIVESKHPDFRTGDIVEGRSGWREFAALDPARLPLRKIGTDGTSPALALGVLGMPGQTAHACMIEIGRVKAGETVVISAAGGVVGSTAGQIGKLLGARVIGIAGSDEKGASLRQLGFDACVNYRSPSFAADLAAACPKGIDVYIENVGGAVTQAVLPLMKYGARMPVCGYIAYYGIGMEGPGPDRLPGFMRLIMSKGMEVRGFGGAMVGGEKALQDLTTWVREGKITAPQTIINGLENTPSAFAGIFKRNDYLGKLLVRVADPAAAT